MGVLDNIPEDDVLEDLECGGSAWGVNHQNM